MHLKPRFSARGRQCKRLGLGDNTIRKRHGRRRRHLISITFDQTPDPTYQFALLQLYLHALISGVLRNVVSDATELIRTRTRGFSHGSSEELWRDPLLQNVLGKLASIAFALESVVLAAVDALDSAYGSLKNAVLGADLSALASLRASEAKVHIDEIATHAAAALFEVGGVQRGEAVVGTHFRTHRPTLCRIPD